ncbi:MAG: pyrroline-5-carboxylate reductase dimerization domain-containing protein, partial [Oscillospiraceae bacterium]|nr:pyrroline-5-carboxylate reductase dimerization domain-containing protein [Oscillospiraceae bacterium]
CDILSLSGKLDALDEKLIDAASAVSGCGPAFVYLFIQAMADGGVKCGLPRDKALAYAEQTVLGAAKLAIESGEHPEKLKDDVCSPGGTTIEGVRAMEEGKVRAAMIDAVTAAFEKSKKL